MTINAKYIGQSTIQITNSFQNGQGNTSLVPFMTFANAIADAMTGTQPLQVGSLSQITFDAAQAGVTPQTASLYSPTPSSNTGWTYYDAFWGGQDGTAGSTSAIYTQVFRSVNKDGITAKNIVLRYNTREQVINTTTYQYWDTQANYDLGYINITANTATPTGTCATGNNVIVVSANTNIQIGQLVAAANVSPLTTVTNVIGNSIILSSPVVGPVTGTVQFSNMLHTGTNEAWTYFDSAPIPYNLSLCDFIVNVSPRWCILHSYLNGEPGMWAGVVETAREDIMDTPSAKNPCWGWVSSTLWGLGANISPSIATKSLTAAAGATNNDHTLISMPRTKIGNSGVAAAKGWAGDFGITSSPTWLANTAAPMIYYLGSAGGKFAANAWDTARRLTLPIKPIADFGLSTVTNYGQIFGMKVLAPVGQNMNKISIAADSDGNSNTAALDRSHWLLNCHYKPADGNNWLTANNSTIGNAQWAVTAKPLGMVSVGSVLYYFTATTIGKVDMITGANQDIVTAQSGLSDIKYDGERYVYVVSTSTAVSIYKIDITNDNVGTTVSKTYASGGAQGAATFVLTDATGVLVGQSVSGTGIGAGAIVTGISTNTITVSVSNALQVTSQTPIIFTNSQIISTLGSAAGFNVIAINGDTICVANNTASATPTFTRFVRQQQSTIPAPLVTTTFAPVCTAATVNDSVQIRDLIADFEGNFWAAPIFTTVTNTRPIRIDRNPSATLPVLTFLNTTVANTYGPTVYTSVNINMIDGNNIHVYGTQTAAAATQYVQFNPRSLSVIANGAGPIITASTAGASGSYAKIQGNIMYLHKHSTANGVSQLIPLGRTITNVLPAPVNQTDITYNYGSFTTFGTVMFWDGVKLFMSSENSIRYFSNFNGGTINGGNPINNVITLGQVVIPA